MTAPRLNRREIVLVCITALVCFAIAIPLSRAAPDQAQRQFTVWPGSSARFANMDLVCEYNPGEKATDSGAVFCHRESVLTGPATVILPTTLNVLLCKAQRNPACLGTSQRRWVRTVG